VQGSFQIMQELCGKIAGIILVRPKQSAWYNAAMAKIKTPESIKDMPLAIVTNVVVLATSGFGLVVALAWNEAIKGAVETYIAPLLGEQNGVISLFVYAIVMTLLAVVVTMQLARIQKTLEHKTEKEIKNKTK
jgi:hypothetical protein